MTQDRIGGNGHEMPLFSDYFHYLLGETYQRVMLDLKEGVKLAVSLFTEKNHRLFSVQNQ